MKTELTKIAATMQTLTSTLLVLAGRVADSHREDAPEPCPLCGTEMPVDSQTHTTASGDECEGVCPDCSRPVSYDDDLERYLHVDDHATCFMQQASTDLLRNDAYHRDDRIQRRMVSLVHSTTVGGWTADTDYMVGTLFWVHPSLPDLAFYATPNWERNDSISGDYVSYAAHVDVDHGTSVPHEPESLFGEVKVEDGGWPDGDPETLAAYMAIVRPLLAKAWAHYNPPPSDDGFHCHGCNKHHGDEEAMMLDGDAHMYCEESSTRLDLFPCQHCGVLVPCTEALGHTGSEKHPDTEYFCPDCFGEHSVIMTDDDMPLPGDEPVALWLVEDDIQTLLMTCGDSVNVMERLLEAGWRRDDRTTRTPAEIKDVKRLSEELRGLLR